MTHHLRRKILPFTAIVGQEDMRLALILNTINPAIGGVLIRGEKGTAKSTAVRALADLLPEIEVVKGCPFNCNPHDEREMCDACYERFVKGEALEVVRRKMPVVELPLGATEERVVGTLDVERAIKEGIKALEPGILAEANRGILYIDEVNLLDDHVADVLLDAAAMGVNIVEREGISVAHPSKFILIGTMNPEEGELRPQLLDRFGLQVEVESIDDVDKRVEIVKVVEYFDEDPEKFAYSFDDKQEEMKNRILHAKSLLRSVSISDDMLRMIARACVELGVKTHRAEIVVVRTAKALAAFNGRREVVRDDVKKAMMLALPHRMRRKPFESPTIEQQKIEEALAVSKDRSNEHENHHEHNHEHHHEHHENHHEHNHDRHSADVKKSAEGGGEQYAEAAEGEEGSTSLTFGINDAIDASFIMRMRSTDRKYRMPHGRHVKTLTTSSKGRYFRAKNPMGNVRDIAIDATIRAAALRHARMSHRTSSATSTAMSSAASTIAAATTKATTKATTSVKAPPSDGGDGGGDGGDEGDRKEREKRMSERMSGVKIAISDEDIMEKVRVGKTSFACVFVVDASGSMGVMKRMESAKGAVLSLLMDAYRHRDKIGLVAFRGKDADVVLPLCTSVDLAKKMLENIPTGGRTPLAAGILKGFEMLINERRKNRDVIPMLVIISDGRANVPLSLNSPSACTELGELKTEILKISEMLADNNIWTVVIDAEQAAGSNSAMGRNLSPRIGFCHDIAKHACGRYYEMRELSADSVRSIVHLNFEEWSRFM